MTNCCQDALEECGQLFEYVVGMQTPMDTTYAIHAMIRVRSDRLGLFSLSGHAMMYQPAKVSWSVCLPFDRVLAD
jgi:hypothetical protein